MYPAGSRPRRYSLLALTVLAGCPAALPDLPDQVTTDCGNGRLDPGEVCDDGGREVADGCDLACREEPGWACVNPAGASRPSSCRPYCGDGLVRGHEGCDDFDSNLADACPSGPLGSCQTARCGDGFVWQEDGGTEECDAGSDNSDSVPDACRRDCRLPRCGDGVLDPGRGETCDDGNLLIESCAPGLACRVCGPGCYLVPGQAYFCGDGYLWGAGDGGSEACDAGSDNSDSAPDACRGDCTLARCGDQVIDTGEDCDDGNDLTDACVYGLLSCNVCTSTCRFGAGLVSYCGDAVTDGAHAELCDNGLRNSDTEPDACRLDCAPARCGDGVTDPGRGEACDDGNDLTEPCAYGQLGCTTCASGCQWGAGWPSWCGDGVTDTAHGEQCDAAGNNSDDTPDACRSTCRLPACGDGVTDPLYGELCDDGDGDTRDACPDGAAASCQPARCGDGFVWDEDGGTEDCDDGPANTWSPCSDCCRPNCALQTCGDGVTDPGEDCDDANWDNDDGCIACRLAEYRVNAYTAGDQLGAALALGGGTIMTVWESAWQDGSAKSVYGRRQADAGGALGPERRINSYTTSLQEQPRVALDASGAGWVVWASYGQDVAGTYGVYAQRIAADGSSLGAELRVNTTTAGDQYYPDVAVDDSGNAVVVWQATDPSGAGVYGQRYSNLGVPQGGEFLVNTTTLNAQQAPAVAMDGEGAFVIAWQSFSQDGDGWGIFAQRYAASGLAQGGEIRANASTASHQIGPALATAAEGAFLVAWTHEVASLDYDVRAQRFAADGSSLGAELLVNSYVTGEQSSPAVACNAAGACVIAWESRYQDAMGYGVFAQRLAAEGHTVGVEMPINVYQQDDQRSPAVAMLASGDFVIAWSSRGQEGTAGESGVYAQRYDASGQRRGLLPW